MKKTSLKEAIDAARESYQPQVPSVPIQFDGEPRIDVVCTHCGFTREAHPVSYCLVYQEPSITSTKPAPERSTAMSPVFAAPYKGVAGLDFDDFTKQMCDAMPILSLVDSYLKPRPEGFLEVKDGAVGLVDKPTTFPDFTSAYSSDYTPKAESFNAQTHDGSAHHYIENYGGTVERGFKSPPDVTPLFTEPWTGTIAEAVEDYDKRVLGAMSMVDEIVTRPLRTEDITTELLDTLPCLLRNMVEANGKTIKQNNMECKHTIPIDTLVELENGVRLFVHRHDRDCDSTPLYALAAYQTTSEEGTPLHLSTGHGEDDLTMVDTALDAKEEHC